jgi:CubicO group peptidase (beta-lactamase class C family)
MTPDLDRLAAAARRRLRLPSLALAYSHAGSDAVAVTGWRGTGPADAATLYRLASCSKSFIATALLLLVAEGRCGLDEPLIGYLPEVAFFTPELTAAVTPRDLLSHRTGLPRHDISSFANPRRSLAEMGQSIRWLEPAYPLRARFHYQNHMFGVISLLVEKLSGEPWQDFVGRRLLAPLGLTRTVTGFAAWRRDRNRARPFVKAGRANLPFLEADTDSTGAAGSVSASVADLLAWAKFHRDGGAGLVPAELLAQAHSAQTPIRDGEITRELTPFSAGRAYGLGWFTETFRGEPMVFHSGTIFGFQAMMGFLPSTGAAFAVLANQDSTIAPDALGYTLADAALGAEPFDWIGFYLDNQRAGRADKAAATARLLAAPRDLPSSADAAGRYRHPAYGEARVSRRGRALVLDYAGFRFRLRPSQEAEYAIYSRLAGLAFPCWFDRTPGGRALLVGLEQDLDHPIRFEAA